MNLKAQLGDAMQAESPSRSFRNALKRLLKEGTNRETLRQQLLDLRQEADEKQEDVILEVLNFLDG